MEGGGHTPRHARAPSPVDVRLLTPRSVPRGAWSPKAQGSWWEEGSGGHPAPGHLCLLPRGALKAGYLLPLPTPTRYRLAGGQAWGGRGARQGRGRGAQPRPPVGALTPAEVPASRNVSPFPPLAWELGASQGPGASTLSVFSPHVMFKQVKKAPVYVSWLGEGRAWGSRAGSHQASSQAGPRQGGTGPRAE